MVRTLLPIALVVGVAFAPADVPKKSVFDPNHGSNGRCPLIGGKADSATARTYF
jgi:hypothetical protein